MPGSKVPYGWPVVEWTVGAVLSLGGERFYLIHRGNQVARVDASEVEPFHHQGGGT